MPRAWMRRGGVALPFVFLIFACVPSPPAEGVWTLPRGEDPLGVFPEKQTFRVVYRDGAVYHGPPWREEAVFPPAIVVRREGQTLFWMSRDQRALFRIRPPRVETLLSLPDSVPSALLGVDPERDAFLVTLTSRLLLWHEGRWWTLPFQGQTAALRVRGGTLEVFWAVQGLVMGSLSQDGGRTWAAPETLLTFPYPVLEIHPLRSGLVLGWSPVLGPPLGYIYLELNGKQKGRKPLLLWGGNQALVGSRALEAHSLLILVTTPVDTAFRPEGVRVRMVDRLSGIVETDTLLLPGMWVYDAELHRDVLSVVAARGDTLVRRNLKLGR